MISTAKTGRGETQNWGGAALQRCDKGSILTSGFQPLRHLWG